MYLNQVSSQFRLPEGRQGDARLHRDFSVLGHDGLGSELAGRGGAISMVRTEETPTAHGVLQGGETASHVDGGGGDGEYDMGLDEFLEVLKEELPIVVSIFSRLSFSKLRSLLWILGFSASKEILLPLFPQKIAVTSCCSVLS
jgi:hypothetical protein